MKCWTEGENQSSVVRCTAFNSQRWSTCATHCMLTVTLLLEHHPGASAWKMGSPERRIIRHHHTHTATDGRNQQTKQEEDWRVRLVSPDKAFCITSDWVGKLKSCTVAVDISSRVCHIVFVFTRVCESWWSDEINWGSKCLCKPRTKGRDFSSSRNRLSFIKEFEPAVLVWGMHSFIKVGAYFSVSQLPVYPVVMAGQLGKLSRFS